MHKIDIPQWVVDRVIKKRGAEHVFTDLDPADTDADHNGALCAVYTTFGDVMPTDMVVDLLS